MTGVLTALPEELGPLLAGASSPIRTARRTYRARLAGTEVLVAATGEGPDRAGRRAADLLGRYRLDALIGTGLAGALSPALREGEVIAAREVRGADGAVWRADAGLFARASPSADRVGVVFSMDRLSGTAAEKAALGAAHPGVENAVTDLESSGWAAAAARAGVPFLALRAVLDTAAEDLPEAVRRSWKDGRLDRTAVVLRALLRPSVFPELFALRRRTVRAMERIAGLLPALLRAEA